MDIVFVAQYACDICHLDKMNGRFVYLASLIDKNKHQVELVTSDFYHDEKVHFKNIPDSYNGMKITALHEPGYEKNVCLGRIKSHHVLGKNVYQYLKNRKKPDVVYCAVPSLSVASYVAKYCKKNHVKFIVDIQDVWPEAFKLVLNIPIISDIAFAPMTIQANKIYKTADQIIAVSETYMKRGMKKNKKCKHPLAVFLGTESKNFENLDLPEKKDDTFVIAYCGTLAISYDLTLYIEAIAKSKHKANIQLLVMGTGPMEKTFNRSSMQYGIGARFTGNLPYDVMCKELARADVAINPIRKGAAQSIINKVGDYAMAGVPVISTQECPEYRNLLDEYKAGINCDVDDPKTITQAIDLLYENKELREEMAHNSKKLGLEKFDRLNYQKILNTIVGNE